MLLVQTYIYGSPTHSCHTHVIDQRCRHAILISHAEYAIVHFQLVFMWSKCLCVNIFSQISGSHC